VSYFFNNQIQTAVASCSACDFLLCFFYESFWAR